VPWLFDWCQRVDEAKDLFNGHDAVRLQPAVPSASSAMTSLFVDRSDD
jgi:hypothetical protein